MTPGPVGGTGSVEPIAQPSRYDRSHGRTDGRTDEDRPTDTLPSADPSARETRPARHPKAAEARAILASTRANLCPHGVRRRDCREHRPKEEPQ